MAQIHDHVRGNRKPAHLVNLQVRQVKRMLEDNKTDSQIMETLQIPSEPFFRYKFALHPLLTCLLFIYIDIDTVNLSIC